MPRMVWMPGGRLLDYTENAVQDVIDLFRDETGERYAEASVRHLPIPEWDANLVLVDAEQEPPRKIEGVFFGTPFKEDIVRIAAFVIAKKHQGQAHGSRAWLRFNKEAWKRGFRHVQLEVKADNVRAQHFYAQRGLSVLQELDGYYQSGKGYMMRGPLSPVSDEEELFTSDPSYHHD